MKNFQLTRSRAGGILAIACAVAAFPLMTAAETVVRTGSSVSVEVNQTVENDFYAAGSSVIHSGEIKEDMSAAAGSLTINGIVGGDVTAAGGTVQIHSPVGDDVRLVAGEAVIASEVGGDVFVMGGTLKVLSSAKIGGNVYFYGGDAEISGPVEGMVMGRAESFSINSAIGGMDVAGVDIELQDDAVVAGEVSYSSPRELERAAGANVEGEIVRGATKSQDTGGKTFPVVFFLIWLFTTFCFFLLLRSPVEKILESVKKDTFKAGFVGLVAVILGPISGVVLLVTVLGAWLGILSLLATIFLFVVAMMILPITLGGYAFHFWRPHRRLDILSVVSGMLIVVILSMIPVIGGILLFIAYVVTLGSILYILYRKGRGLI